MRTNGRARGGLFILSQKQKHRCYYCKKTVAAHQRTIDHRKPRSKGGGGGKNRVMACWSCNQAKKNMSEREFMISIGRIQPVPKEWENIVSKK